MQLKVLNMRDRHLLQSRLPLISVLFCLLILCAGLAATIGASQIPLFSSQGITDTQWSILTAIRFPRILLAASVGAALAVSGAAMQGLFRNPLADPGLIGISSGAALAVAAVIVLAGPYTGLLGLYGLSIAAFAGGLVSCLVILQVARFGGVFSVTYLLLAGIAVSALSGAATGVLTYLSTDQQLRTLTFWTMGSLGGAMWPAVLVVVTVMLPATWYLLIKAKQINLLLLGEQEAHYLGVDTKHLKKMMILCAALLVGVSVAVSGMIGFIGLVVPHLIRLSVGPDHRTLIPASALLGACLLVVSDTFARIIVAPAEIPVGVITSLIGGPFFLWLLIKQNQLRGNV